MSIFILLFAVSSNWSSRMVLSVGPIYVLIFGLFHFGLMWTTGFLGAAALGPIGKENLAWIYSVQGRQALILACWGILAFTCGLVLAPSLPAAPPAAPQRGDKLQRLGVFGVLISVAGAAMWGYSVLSVGGIRALQGGYLKFLESAQTPMVAYGTWALGLGLALSQLGNTRTRIMGGALFLSFALVAFPLGLRGAVLFPVATWLTTRHRLGRRTPLWLVATVGVGALILSAIVRATRVSQADALVPKTFLDAVSGSISELGFSLYPTVATMRWSASGEPPAGFSSFYIVPLRFLERLLGLPVPPGESDPRIFNVVMQAREGAVGGSPVAEANHAMGMPGVLLVMFVIGVVLGLATRFEKQQIALLPVIALPLFINVRNSFAPVPVQMLLGLLGVWIVMKTDMATRSAPAKKTWEYERQS
nr:O-antigen polysaccharide polymerase Wzy [Pedococcus badiiscoriae]